MKIIYVTALSLFSTKSFAQQADTVINMSVIAGQEFTLVAPQQYYAGYQWILPNGSHQEGKTLTTILNASATQSIQCIAHDTCTDNIAIFNLRVVESGSVGTLHKTTNEISGQSSVYPNPAGEFINIRYTARGYETPVFEIIATDGRMVQTIPIASNNLQVSLHNLAAGLYWYRISEGKKILMQGKIWKQ